MTTSPPADAEHLHALLPHSVLTVLPVGHFSRDEASDVYGGIIGNWVETGHREALPV